MIAPLSPFRPDALAAIDAQLDQAHRDYAKALDKAARNPRYEHRQWDECDRLRGLIHQLEARRRMAGEGSA